MYIIIAIWSAIGMIISLGDPENIRYWGCIFMLSLLANEIENVVLELKKHRKKD